MTKLDPLRRLEGVPVLRCIPAMAGRTSAAVPVLACVVGCLTAVTSLSVGLSHAADTDAWFLLASGRQVIESGIPTLNPWSLEGGLGIVVQQWLHDVWLYAAYLAGGFPAVSASLLVPATLWLAALLWLCREAAGRRIPAYVSLALVGIACALCSSWVTVRPTLWTMALSCACAASAMRWARTRGVVWLILPPLAVAIHANLHASMAWLDLFVVACAAVPATPGGAREALADPRHFLGSRLPIAACLAAMALAMLANPYGLDGALYLFRGYGVATYHDLIRELRHPWEVSVYLFVVWLLSTVVMPVALCVRAGRVPPLPLVAWAAAGTVTGFSAIRNLWISVLPAIAIMAWAWAEGETREEAWSALASRLRLTKGGLPGPASTGVAIAAPITISLALAIATASTGGLATPSDTQGFTHLEYSSTWSYMPEQAGPLIDMVREEGGEQRVCAYIVVNNYMEWIGMPVMLDARPEIWEPAITGDQRSRYLDYADIYEHGGGSGTPDIDVGALRRYVDDYDVGWLIFGREVDPGAGYEQVAETDEYVLWRVGGLGTDPA